MNLPASMPGDAADERSSLQSDEGTMLLNAEAVLADPATSYWLKGALEHALERDPIDALNDALVLAAILDQHLRDVLGIDVDPE